MDAGELNNISDMIANASRISCECFEALGDTEQVRHIQAREEILRKDRQSDDLSRTGQKPTCG